MSPEFQNHLCGTTALGVLLHMGNVVYLPVIEPKAAADVFSRCAAAECVSAFFHPPTIHEMATAHKPDWEKTASQIRQGISDISAGEVV